MGTQRATFVPIFKLVSPHPGVGREPSNRRQFNNHWVWWTGSALSVFPAPVLPVIHFTCTRRRPKLKILGVGRQIWGVGRQTAMRMRMNIQDTPDLRSVYFKHRGKTCMVAWFGHVLLYVCNWQKEKKPATRQFLSDFLRVSWRGHSSRSQHPFAW